MINELQKNKITSYLEKCVEEQVSCGFVFGLVTKEEKWFTYTGNKEITPNVLPTSLDTIYDLASISKVLVTTTLILKLMEEGTISLKTKISDVLPRFKHKNITIQHLITHCSGLPADIVGYKTLTPDEAYDKMYSLDLEYETGTKVVYSDVNFILLGLIISTLKGSLDGYAKETMFIPLDMKDTCYNPSKELYNRLASYEDIKERGGVIKGVVHDGKAFKFHGVSGHAGVFSTIEDISHYIEMLLNDGVYKGKRFFHKETIHLLTKLHTEGLNEKRSIGWILSDSNYALGDYASEKTIYHTGFSGPSIVVDFEKGLGIITLTNRVHPSRENGKILVYRNNIHNLALLALD